MKALKHPWGTQHIALRPGKGTRVVFVNSLGTDLRMWDRLVPLLPTTWSILRLDNRGHGLSERSNCEFSIADLATDTIAAMDDVGFETAVVVGCSVGGMIAVVVP